MRKNKKKMLCWLLSLSMALEAAGICGWQTQADNFTKVQAAEADVNGLVIRPPRKLTQFDKFHKK